MLLLPALGDALLVVRASVVVPIELVHVRSWVSWFLVWEVMFPLPVLDGRIQQDGVENAEALILRKVVSTEN